MSDNEKRIWFKKSNFLSKTASELNATNYFRQLKSLLRFVVRHRMFRCLHQYQRPRVWIVSRSRSMEIVRWKISENMESSGNSAATAHAYQGAWLCACLWWCWSRLQSENLRVKRRCKTRDFKKKFGDNFVNQPFHWITPWHTPGNKFKVPVSRQLNAIMKAEHTCMESRFVAGRGELGQNLGPVRAVPFLNCCRTLGNRNRIEFRSRGEKFLGKHYGIGCESRCEHQKQSSADPQRGNFTDISSTHVIIAVVSRSHVVTNGARFEAR